MTSRWVELHWSDQSADVWHRVKPVPATMSAETMLREMAAQWASDRAKCKACCRLGYPMEASFRVVGP